MIAWFPELVTELAEEVLSVMPDLSESELKLLCTAAWGQVAYYGPTFDDDDPRNDPTRSDSWGPERSIRAYLIRVLCVDASAADRVASSGIRIHACRIEEELDLSCANLRFPLVLRKCRITRPLNLSLAQVEALSLSGSLTAGMSADLIAVRGSLALNSGFRAEGEVRLAGASIGGDFNCSGGRFSTLGANALLAQMPYGPVLIAHGLNVTGSVLFSEGFCAEGTIVLLGAKIGGNLNCDNGHFTNPGGRALIADGLKVNGAAFFRRARAAGEVRLNGATVGELQCARARFSNPGGYALNADGIHVEGSAQLNNGFYSQGEVCLVGGSIAGNLECVGSRFANPGRMALNGDHVRVGASVHLRGCVSSGQVRLLDGKIGGSLECQRGTFLNPGGHAIEACRLDVSGDVFFSDGFRAVGIIHLRGAEIGGQLACPGGKFLNPGRETLDCDGTKVHSNVLFQSVTDPLPVNEFFNAGVISLVGTDIRGNLEFDGARFGPFSAVNACLATVSGAFSWKGVRRDPSLLIHIEGASVGSLEDDDESSWPSPGNLHLDGFTYRRISGRLSPCERLRWLHRQNAKEPNFGRRFLHGMLYGGQRLRWRQEDWPDFRPQPYQQLAKVLR